MKRFKCKVERVNEYIIEFDEEVLDEEWMKYFRSVFFNYHELNEHAEHIAQMRARFKKSFIEGYGVPLIDGEVSYFANEKSVNKAINIIIVSEDEECDVDVEEIK